MSTPFHLIGLVGMPGAGKSVAADFFKQRNIPVLRFGDQTDIGLKEHNLSRNEKNERWYREKLRADLGMAAMAIKIEPRIIEESRKGNRIVLDGLYSWEEYVYLKRRFPQLILLCVYASPDVRYKRLMIRKVRPLTIEEARTRDRAEIENLHKGGPIAIADYLVMNNKTKKEFIAQLVLVSKNIV
ncbi:MAG: AAA family ATPase [Patescibacteria group bacterium]